MARVRFKAADIWDTPDDGKRYEVIDGELYVSPSPSWLHQFYLGNLYLILGPWVYSHRLGKIVFAPLGVVLDEETGVEPDLVYISNDRSHIISERGVEGAPTLVVEVLSPSTEGRDRGIKMRRYATAGIPHYWLLDPQTPALETYRLGEQGYEATGRYGRGESFQPQLFPGLQIVLDELWS